MVTLPTMMVSMLWWIMLLSSSAPRALSFSLHPGPRSGPPTRLAAKHQDDNENDASRGRRDFLQQSLAQTMAVTTAVATTAALDLSLPSATIPMASAAVTASAMPKNSIQLPPMGLGAWAWGDSLFWGCKCDNVAEENIRRNVLFS
jgi:hypothetical protein